MSDSQQKVAYKNPEIPEASRLVLQNSSRIELLWLDPGNDENEDEEIDSSPGEYHGFHIWGRTWVKDSIVPKVVQRVKVGIETKIGWELCFDPHYAVRLFSEAGESEWLFCFYCRNVLIVGPGNSGGYFATDKAPRRLFRRLLKRAGVMPWWRMTD